MLLFIQILFPSVISMQIFYKLSNSKLQAIDSIMKYTMFVFLNNLIIMTITSFFSSRDLSRFFVNSNTASFDYIWKSMAISLPTSIIVAIIVYAIILNFDLKVYRK